MNDKRNDVVTVHLIGADLELLRAGQAQGEASGIRSAIEQMKNAMQAWKDAVLKAAPKRAEEIEAFVASYNPMYGALSAMAEEKTMEGRSAMARAVAAGAGKPRGAVGLRQQASKAMIWAALKLEGS